MTVRVPFKSLKFGPYQVAVKRLSKADGADNWGLYWPSKYQMDLHNEYPTKEKAAEVFLHESLHVILEERGLNLGKKEEVVVTELAKGIAAFLRDNAAASKWFMRCLS